MNSISSLHLRYILAFLLIVLLATLSAFFIIKRVYQLYDMDESSYFVGLEQTTSQQLFYHFVETVRSCCLSGSILLFLACFAFSL